MLKNYEKENTQVCTVYFPSLIILGYVTGRYKENLESLATNCFPLTNIWRDKTQN